MAADFGDRLQEAMEAKDLTGAALAELVEVTPGAVSQWVGGRQVPRRETTERIASALDGEIGWLEYGTGTGPTPDLSAQREEYLSSTGWRLRHLPDDGGRNYGNANQWVFDPTP